MSLLQFFPRVCLADYSSLNNLPFGAVPLLLLNWFQEGNGQEGLHTFVKVDWSNVECKTEIVCSHLFYDMSNYWGSFKNCFSLSFLPCSKRRITLCGLLISSLNLATAGSLRYEMNNMSWFLPNTWYSLFLLQFRFLKSCLEYLLLIYQLLPMRTIP